MYSLNDILNTDNPLEAFRLLHSDLLVDKLNNLIEKCNDCNTNYQKQYYYGGKKNVQEQEKQEGKGCRSCSADY